MRTETRKMTVVEFAKYAMTEAAALVSAPDADRAAVLKAAMKVAAEATDPSAEIEVQVAAADPAALALAAVHTKLDKIEAAVASFAGGVTAKALYDAVVAKQGIAVQLALELLAAHQTKVAALAQQIQAGGADLDKDKIWAALRTYDIEEAVGNALTVLGKAEGADAAALAEIGAVYKTGLAEKLTKTAPAPTDPPAAGTPPAAPAAGDPPAAAPVTQADDDVCKQCGAKMEKGVDVCPACGWTRGTAVSKAVAKFKYAQRIVGRPKA